MFIEANKDDVEDGRRLGVEPICEVLQVAEVDRVSWRPSGWDTLR